jgi:hypothetical protein
VRTDRSWRRRAFQLAHLSEQLALTSEQLADQARVIADAAAKLAEASEELVSPVTRETTREDRRDTDDQLTGDPPH